MVLKCKRVSYGLVELYDNGTTWARYCIRVNRFLTICRKSRAFTKRNTIDQIAAKNVSPEELPFRVGHFYFSLV